MEKASECVGCKVWEPEAFIEEKVSLLLASNETRQLAQELNALSAKGLQFGTVPRVKVSEPTWHDVYRRLMEHLFQDGGYFSADKIVVFHCQTYSSLQLIIPNFDEKEKNKVKMAENCDFLMVAPHQLQGKRNLMFSLELKREAKTTGKDNNIEQVQKYLKHAIIHWKKSPAYGALGDANGIRFFKMEKVGRDYITYNSDIYQFPLGENFREEMIEGLCRFIALVRMGL